MAFALSNLFGRSLSLFRLTGPIFDKELRVSSRRPRNYIVRSLYLFFLMNLLLIVWIKVIEHGGSALYTVSRMAEAGKIVIVCAVWFQFCVTQVLAVIMLSTSISDEIYHRTLGLLMTTPISSFQIVMGKLLSKLLQLILLLAISLPLLAIVRVFGGVPWDYVVSSLCITLTTVIFSGSMSLFFSIFTRRAYVVIITAALTLFVILAVLPYLTAVLWFAATDDWPNGTLTAAIFYHNPYAVLAFSSMKIMEPGGAGGAGWLTFHWPLHCGIILAASAVLLFLTTVSVRRVALRQATGQLDISSKRHRLRTSADRVSISRQVSSTPARRVAGPPVIWKEVRFPRLGRLGVIPRLAITVGLILIFASYYLCSILNTLNDGGTHIVYAFIYLGLGFLFTIVVPSTCITSEKESRSWPLLLATTLNDREILFGKFMGALWRCLPIWLLLLGHTAVFSLAGTIHPVAIVYITVLVLWVAVLLCGSGLYFSSRCRRTTTAVVLNFVFVLSIWAIVPLLLFFAVDERLCDDFMATNPFIHAGATMDATVGTSALTTFDWLGAGRWSVFKTTIWMLICVEVFGSLGLLFAWRAKCRLRRNIF